MKVAIVSIMVTPILRSENDTPQYGTLSNADTLMVLYRVENIDDVMEFSHYYEVEEGYEEYTEVKYKKKL